MIFDKLLMLSNAQAVTSSAASTDVIDFGVARDMFPTLEDLKLVVQVGAAFTASGSATMTIAVQTSVDNSSWTDHMLTRAIAVADLVAGASVAVFSLGGIGAGVSAPRYLRLNYTIATGPMTAGTITAGFVLDRQSNRPYPTGIPTVAA